jgi:hypothetical protein
MSTELSIHTQPRGLALQSVADAMKFGEMVSSSDFAPKDFRGKPASCMLAIQCGAEIGLAPLQSLQSIAVVNGRPSVYGDAALALVKASPVCEYVTESIEGDGDQMTAICTAKRRGYPQPTVVRFTVADAKKASLWGKSGPWTQYPKRMLQMRARGFALRDCFPDVLKGLVTAEEAQDYQHEPAREPVVVRPKFPKTEAPAAVDCGRSLATATQVAQPPAASATNDPVANARLAVQRTNSLELLAALRDRVNQRHREGTFTEAQRNELVHLIDGKCEWLESEPEDNGQEFEHEAAATENAS